MAFRIVIGIRLAWIVIFHSAMSQTSPWGASSNWFCSTTNKRFKAGPSGRIPFIAPLTANSAWICKRSSLHWGRRQTRGECKQNNSQENTHRQRLNPASGEWTEMSLKW